MFLLALVLLSQPIALKAARLFDARLGRLCGQALAGPGEREECEGGGDGRPVS